MWALEITYDRQPSRRLRLINATLIENIFDDSLLLKKKKNFRNRGTGCKKVVLSAEKNGLWMIYPIYMYMHRGLKM